MKIRWSMNLVILGLSLAAASYPAPSQAGMWISAYYAGYMQGTGLTYHLRASQIDFGAVTHIIHFALIPNADGTLDDQKDKVTAANADSITRRAHAVGKKVLICVGGSSSEAGFLGATSEMNLSSFINNLLTLTVSRHYDGVDVDWEPLTDADTAQYSAFVTKLRSTMMSSNSELLLTAAVGSEPELFGRLQDRFDQINIMTYHLSGPYAGWVTWHNAAILNGGYKFPDSTRYLPCADAMVREFTAAGIAHAKLGIGLDFYGAVWSGGTGTPTGGVTAPRQNWTTPPSLVYQPYYAVMDSFYTLRRYHWDLVAEAAYLSIDTAGSSNDKFISYDDQTTCVAKVGYARSQGLGGLIIWELGAGWRPNSAVPDTLLRTVKIAAFGVTSVGSDQGTSEGQFVLAQNFPNPFNPFTTIRYALPYQCSFTLVVYDILGRQVAAIVRGEQTAGEHVVRFDASGLPSGVYFYRMRAGDFVQTKALLVVK